MDANLRDAYRYFWDEKSAEDAYTEVEWVQNDGGVKLLQEFIGFYIKFGSLCRLVEVEERVGGLHIRINDAIYYRIMRPEDFKLPRKSSDQ